MVPHIPIVNGAVRKLQLCATAPVYNIGIITPNKSLTNKGFIYLGSICGFLRRRNRAATAPQFINKMIGCHRGK